MRMVGRPELTNIRESTGISANASDWGVLGFSVPRYSVWATPLPKPAD